METKHPAVAVPPGAPTSRSETRAVRRRHRPEHHYRLVSAASVAMAVLVWFILTNTVARNADGFPSPQLLALTFLDLVYHGYTGKPLWAHVLTSLSETLGGFTLAVAVGVPVGLVVGYYRMARAIAMPFIDFMRPIPPISLVTIFVFYFGIGFGSKVALIFLTGFWFMILATTEGVRSLPKDYYRAAKSMGMRPGQIFRMVVLPGALPSILTGMRTTLSISWALVVAAELIASQVGLGYMITDASNFYKLPIVYVVVLIIATFGFIMDRTVVAINHRVLHWQGK
ncbi:ABC transporter permease [Paraburkholderia agricolaris]|uniref:ABC transporter permease n=1 Tax=Paraburkholderia agricolaris TaxID=2152888 RepID=UPI001292015A|nr:ABC transporter permease [Paraburkholderia agricolaris]